MAAVAPEADFFCGCAAEEAFLTLGEKDTAGAAAAKNWQGATSVQPEMAPY